MDINLWGVERDNIACHGKNLIRIICMLDIRMVGNELIVVLRGLKRSEIGKVVKMTSK